jgi:hypothetical protein
LKADDPRLEESLKRLTERIKKLDDTILTVLKNHVAVEQFMGAFSRDNLVNALLVFVDKSAVSARDMRATSNQKPYACSLTSGTIPRYPQTSA